MNPKKMYQCSGCYSKHEDEKSALECCSPREIFVCAQCGDFSTNEQEAASCCESIVEDDGLRFPAIATSVSEYIETYQRLNNIKS